MGNAVSKKSTTSIANAGVERSSSRIVWAGSFMDAPCSEGPGGLFPYRHILIGAMVNDGRESMCAKPRDDRRSEECMRCEQ